MPDTYSPLSYALAGYGKKNPYDYRRQFGYSMLQHGMDSSPIQSPWQGVARIAQAMLGGYMAHQADEDQTAANQERGTKLAAAIAKMQTDPTGGMADLSAIDPDLGARYGAQLAMKNSEIKAKRDSDNQAASFLLPPSNGPAAAGAPQPPSGGGTGDYGRAISGIESAGQPNGGYGAVGPDTGHGRAVGKYQIMDFNVGPWTKEVLGQEMTPEQFRASPQAQDAVFNGKFGQYVKQFGSPEAAARAWFAGPGGMNNPNAADVNGMTVGEYGRRFAANLGPTQTQLNDAYAHGRGVGDQTQPVGTPDNPVQINSTGGPGYGAIPIPNARPGEGQPTPIPNYVPGTAQPQLAQGGAMPPNANGQGDSAPPVAPPQADPGAQFEAAARRAQAAGRGDIALKYIQMATQARETAAKTTLQHVDLGDSIGVMDPRSGQIVQRIPKGAAPGTGNVVHVDLGDSIGILDPKTGSIVQRIPKGQAGGGAFPGKDQHSAALNLVIQGTKDPNFVNTPEYAAAWSTLNQPHQSFDEATQRVITIPPMNLGWAPKPGFTGQPQGAPQVPPQDGTPPAANPGVTSGPAVVAPGQPTATSVAGLPPKPPNADQAKAGGFADRMEQADRIARAADATGTSLIGNALEHFGVLGNKLQSEDYQKYKQAKDSFINSQLRWESGAAISDAEYRRADQQYFPQPGDSPQIIQQKAEARRAAIIAMQHSAGPGYKPSADQSQSGPKTPQGYKGPDGRPISMQDIEATAKNRGISTDEVIKRLGLQPVQ